MKNKRPEMNTEVSGNEHYYIDGETGEKFDYNDKGGRIEYKEPVGFFDWFKQLFRRFYE